MSHNLGTTEVIDDPMSNEDIVNQDNISDEDIEMMTNNYEISGSRPIYNEEGELREAINNTSREEAQRAIQAAITLQSMRIQEQMELDENAEEEIPDEFKCPISLDLMQDPVLAADGHSYDRVQIESWFRTSHVSPNTRLNLNTLALYPNIELRNRINSWLSERSRPELPPPRQNRHAVNTTNHTGGAAREDQGGAGRDREYDSELDIPRGTIAEGSLLSVEVDELRADFERWHSEEYGV